MKRKPTAERVAELERKIELLERGLRDIAGERVNFQEKPRVRIAKTWSVDAPSYPDEGNTFGLLFLDGKVDQSGPGFKPVTYTAHSNPAVAPTQHGTTIDNSYVERDTRVFVLDQDNRYWIWPLGEEEPA